MSRYLRRPPLALIVICALYVMHRALVLHTNFDSVCIPNYEMLPMGDLAQVAYQGWHGAPIRDFYDNCGGHLMTGLFAAPLYWLFGDTYLSLKLVPLLLGLGCILLIWSVAMRLWGHKVATLAAFLFVVGPPTLVKYSMLAKGNHFENLFFQLLVVWAFVRLHQSERRVFWLAIFACTAGFSIFFYFGSMLMVLLLLATHLAIRFEWRLSAGAFLKPLRDLGIMAVPFVVGLAPLIWVQYGTQRPTEYIDNHLVGGNLWTNGIERLNEFRHNLLPKATCFEDFGPISGSLADRIYLILFLGSWSVGIWVLLISLRALFTSGRLPIGEAERTRFQLLNFVPFVLYFPSFVLVYAVSSYRFDLYNKPIEIGQFRYMVPHFAFVPLLVGAVVHWTVARRKLLSGTIGRTLAGGFVGLGLMIIPLVDWSFAQTGLGSNYPGYHWGYYKNALMRDALVDKNSGQFTWDFETMAKYIDEFPPADQIAISQGVGHHIAFSQCIDGWIDGKLVTPGGLHVDKVSRLIPNQNLLPALTRGMGTYLRRPIHNPTGGVPAMVKQLELLEASEDPMAEYVVEGLCMDLDFPLLRSLPEHLQLTDKAGKAMPQAYRDAWYRGQGIQMGMIFQRGWGQYGEKVRARVEAIPEERATEYWLGVGIGVALDGQTPDSGQAWVGLLPAAHRAAFWQGVGASLRNVYPPQELQDVLRRLPSEWEPQIAGSVSVPSQDQPPKWEQTQIAKDLKKGAQWPQFPLPYRYTP